MRSAKTKAEQAKKATKALSIPGAARGWIYTALFGHGGTIGRPGTGLAVHAINPERGTNFSLTARLTLLGRALQKSVPRSSATVYLTAAGFLGCATLPGNTPRELRWLTLMPAQVSWLERNLIAMMAGFRRATWLAVGVDISPSDQQLWWCQGRSRTILKMRRVDDPGAFKIGRFWVRPFICGAIIGKAGVKLDRRRHLATVDVVLDASHASLNREWNGPPGSSWQAFHSIIYDIGRTNGAVFAHAHGADFRGTVRDCDNWVVYRGRRPFPGERRGQDRAKRQRAGQRI